MPLKTNEKQANFQALGVPLKLTRFPTRGAYQKKELTLSLADLATWIMDQRAASKDALPWLKMATFGTKRRPGKDGKGRSPVVEVLLNSPLAADYIRKGEVHLIKDLMAKSNELGMQTLDQSLVAAFKEGIITREDAVRYADSANDVRLQIKMFEKSVGAAPASREELGLSFETPDPGKFTRR